MKKFLLLTTFIYLILFVVSLQLWTIWLAYLTVWFLAGIAIYFKFLSNTKKSILWISIFLIYPVIETAIKYMIVKNIIPGSWFWLNNMEHFFWSISFSVFITPIFFKNFCKNCKIYNFIFIVCFVNLIGVFNEFIEFIIRYQYSLSNLLYYSDTIKDLFINLLGALVGAFLTQIDLSLYSKEDAEVK